MYYYRLFIIFVSTLILSISSNKAISMETFSNDLSPESKHFVNIDKALSEIVQTANVISQLQNKNIQITEAMQIRYKKGCAAFVLACQSAHPILTSTPADEADVNFFSNYNSFVSTYINPAYNRLIQNGKINPKAAPPLYNLNYSYYESAFNFFIYADCFEDASKVYMQVHALDPAVATTFMKYFISQEVRKNETLLSEFKDKSKEEQASIAAERYFILSKYASLYKDIHERIQAQENRSTKLAALDNLILYNLLGFYLHYDSEQMQIIIGHLKAALNAPLLDWPIPDALWDFNRNIVQKELARIYYTISEYADAQKCFSCVPEQTLEISDYVKMAVIFAKKGAWKESLLQIRKFGNKGTKFDVDVVEALSLIEVLLRMNSNGKMNLPAAILIKSIKEAPRSLIQEIETLVHDVQKAKAQEKQERIKRLRHKAMAHQQFQNICPLYTTFDIQYQNLWMHCSTLPAEMQNLLDPLNELSHKIRKQYQTFISYQKDESTYADNVGHIMDLGRSLRENLSAAFQNVIKINRQISELRRQLYKKNIGSQNNREAFRDFEPTSISEAKSLKYQICNEQKAQQEKAEEKNKLAEHQQQARKEKREFLAKEYEEKQQRKQQATESTTTATTTTETQNETPYFSNSEVVTFWETHAWEKWNLSDLKIMKMLFALDKAKTLHELRPRVPKSARLERLDGDREGQLSLRVNDQWRLCFYWIIGEGPINIEVIDYH
jgi:toxin HigB-1